MAKLLYYVQKHDIANIINNALKLIKCHCTLITQKCAALMILLTKQISFIGITITYAKPFQEQFC